MGRAWTIVLICAAPAFADRVVLKGGGVLTGVVVESNERGVVLEVGPGRIGLPASRVERVETGASALGSFRARAATLPPGDAASWVELAFWARAQGLETQAREALERALQSDPQNADAHRALGHVLLGGAWLSLEESYRAQGLLPFEGGWVTPAEREAAFRERAALAAADAARREAEARVREAEARAQAAEAVAQREANAKLAAGPSDAGIPYWWVVAGGGCNGCGVRPHRPHPKEPAPPPAAAPRTPPPRDMGRPQTQGQH